MIPPELGATVGDLRDLLRARGLVSADALTHGENVAQKSQARLPAVLTRLGLLSERDLCDAFASLLRIPRLTKADLSASATLPDGLNQGYFKSRKLLPLSVSDSGVALAMADPLDEAALSAVAFAFRRPVLRMVAEESDIDDALEGLAEKIHDGEPASPSAGKSGLELDSDIAALNDRNSEAPVIRLVSRLIAKAVTLHASDIHIEPQSDSLWVRFRVDGDLGELETFPKRFIDPVVSRVKLMARLDIAEKRLPQDGRIQTSVRGNSVDLRVATFPSMHGESLVVRILGQQDVELDLDSVGLSEPGLSALKSALAQPNGLILITGPTGSGKTTTLYAALNALRVPRAKLMTVEDPIEFTLPGISQLQVKQEIGLTFATALRSVLRNDPDIIMVGEIRDKETADIAVRAALTGHLVLATLHTNTAAGAITRLLDLGVEHYLLASVLLLTSAQRLVRRLCTNCSFWVEADTDEVLYLGSHETDGPASDAPTIRRPRGCSVCKSRGYLGRTPLFEAIAMSDRLRRQIHDGFDEAAFEKSAVEEGTRTLIDDGRALVARGVTTPEEVALVVGGRYA